MPNIKLSRLVSITEAADILTVSRQQINIYCRVGTFKTAEKVGNTWVIERKEVEEFKNKQKNKGV